MDFSYLIALSKASFSSFDKAYSHFPSTIGFAYIFDVSLPYIPFNTIPVLCSFKIARAKLKLLPVSLYALYLTNPIFFR